jgi:hypothetical protein
LYSMDQIAQAQQQVDPNTAEKEKAKEKKKD